MATALETPTVDVVLTGPIFFDLVLGDLDASPAPGTEVYAASMAESPGGIANLAVATARLGLGTSLASALGDDVRGRWCRTFLEREGVDLSRTPSHDDWPTPVTVAIAHDGDRAMVTREEPVPTPSTPVGIGARAALVDLASLPDGEDAWWRAAASAGTRIFADIGWDATGAWDPARLRPLDACFAFTPNEREAMAYTRTDTPVAAARALAERVPLVVVTCGADGVVAVDSAAGIELQVPAVPTVARDTTGAGDVFGAGLVAGVLGGLPLVDGIALATLCAGLAVAEHGGAVAAPGWGDIADWWDTARDDAPLARRFAFLDGALPAPDARRVRRAERRFPFSEFTG